MSTQSFKVKSGLTISPVDLTTLTNPQAGDLACDINDSNKIKRYDAASSSWTEVGSGAAGDVDTLLVQDFDSASLSSFTQTGLALVTTNQLDGRQSARLIHQPLVGAIQSFKETFSVSPKYRGVNMTASLLLRSSASQGNVTIQFRDETNSVDYPSQQLQTNSQEIASLVTNSTTLVSGFSNSNINSLKVGMSVTGSGIPTGTTIASINSTALTITLSQAATASATVSLRFSDLPRTIQLGFQIPANCSSYSYTISALQEAGLPETYIDDIVLKNYWLGMSNQGQSTITVEVPAGDNEFNAYVTESGGAYTLNSQNINWVGSIVKNGTGDVTINFSVGLTVPPSAQASALGRNVTISSSTTTSVRIQILTAAGAASDSSFWINISKMGVDFVTSETKTFITNDLVPAKAVLGNTSLEIPSITGWQGYTPTFQGFGSPSAIEFEWRQVGENVEIRGKFTSGVSTAVEARVGLPAGLTSAGTGIIPSIQAVGATAISTNASTRWVLIEPSVTYITFGVQGLAGLTKETGSSFLASGQTASFFASVPCAGLSATEEVVVSGTQSALVQEADGHYQLNNFTYRTASTATGILYFNDGTLVANIGDHITKLSDSVNGDQFIATKTGTYSINATVEIGATSGSVYLVRNNTSAVVANILSAFYEAGSNAVSHLSWTGYLNEGDILRFIRTGGVATFAASDYNVIDIAYQGSLKQVSVSSDQKITIPTSELRFEGASSRGSTATAIVKFDTMAKLRGDAFTVESDSVLGTYITMKKAGKLDVSANLIGSTTGGVGISRNQTTLTTNVLPASEVLTASNPSAASFGETVAWSGFVAVGDIIRVYAGANPTSNNVNNFNLSFQEQDISVSVTNTLPQFSESDSSVRVDTANGYGSTATKIRRFSNVRDNIGTDVVYTDDAINGASFRIVTDGVYMISYNDNFTTPGVIGVSKNASSLTTSVNSLTASEVLALSLTAQNNYVENLSVQAYLVAGDIIRPHTDGLATGTGSASRFTISKVGKPNVTGVDVTPFVNVPQPESQSSTIQQVASFGVATITGSLTGSKGTGIYSYDSSTGIYTVLKNCSVVLSFGADPSAGSTVQPGIQIDGSTFSRSNSPAVAGQTASTSYSGTLTVGQNFRFVNGANTTSAQRISVLATALSDQILTAPETFSTDTAALKYIAGTTDVATTLANLANQPVGTYTTFTYAANTNTRSITSTRPTQTDADMNANGILLYTRAYNALSSAAQPAAIAIQIGKGLKGKSLDIYKAAAKVNSGDLDLVLNSSTEQRGVYYKNYNESTGILLVDAGEAATSAITVSRFFFVDQTTQTSGYLVINASKNPALTGLGFGSVVRAKYTSNSGQAVGTSATLLTMEDSVYDSNNAYISGVYTVPENGTYIIAANWVTGSVAISASTGSMNISIYVDGVLASNSFIRGTGNTLAHLASITDQFVLRKGQTISIYGACTSATTMASGSFSITKFSVVKDN